MKKQTFDITGMSCAACASHVEKAAAAQDGVKEAAVSLLTNVLTVVYDESRTGADQICAAVKKSGYGCAPAGERTPKAEKRFPTRLVISAIFSMT